MTRIRTAIKQSKYKHIYWDKGHNKKRSSWMWNKLINGVLIKKRGFETDREAALALDKALIERNLEPINILVKKN